MTATEYHDIHMTLLYAFGNATVELEDAPECLKELRRKDLARAKRALDIFSKVTL